MTCTSRMHQGSAQSHTDTRPAWRAPAVPDAEIGKDGRIGHRTHKVCMTGSPVTMTRGCSLPVGCVKEGRAPGWQGGVGSQSFGTHTTSAGGNVELPVLDRSWKLVARSSATGLIELSSIVSTSHAYAHCSGACSPEKRQTRATLLVLPF